MRRPGLLPRRLHLPALLVALVCWLGMVLLGVHFAGQTRPSAFDARIMDHVHEAFGHRGMPGELLVGPTDAVVLAAFILLGLALAFWRRSWPLAGFVAACPLLAELIGDVLLKPAFGRTYGRLHYLSYPSGHTIAGVTTLTVLLLIALGSARTVVRVGAVLLWVVLLVSLALGLVTLNYHYPTDVVGGFALAVGTVLPLAVLTDRIELRRP